MTTSRFKRHAGFVDAERVHQLETSQMNHRSTMQRLIHYFSTPARPHNQSGFGLAPVLAGLAITLLVFQGFSAALAHYRATPRINETAAHMEKVSQAAAKYVQDNYGQLTNALTLNGPATTITTQALRDAGYFSQTLSDTNPYGQSYSVRVRYVTQGSGANQRNVLEPMVLTEGGHSIPDNEALRIAGKVDAGGSIRSSDPSLAIGNNGGWQVALSDFGGSPGEGHLAVGMFYSDAGLIADYLYRNALPGRPEVNQMNTDIDMAGNSVNNAETVQAAQAHLTRIVSEGTACAPNGAIARNTAGIPMVCENGIWTQSATLNWIPSQGQRLQMTAANGQSISIQNDNGRFRWVNSDWTAELASVDQLGNLSAAGRLRTGEFLQIDGIAVEGEACSPDGLIGRDAAGLILSCKSGIWGFSIAGGSCNAAFSHGSICQKPYLGQRLSLWQCQNGSFTKVLEYISGNDSYITDRSCPF